MINSLGLRLCIVALATTAQPPINTLLAEENNSLVDIGDWQFGWDRGVTYDLLQPIPYVNLGEANVGRHIPEFDLAGRIGAELTIDGGYLTQIPGEDDQFKGELRRGRVYTTGKLSSFWQFDYKVQFSIEDNDFFLNDFFLELPFQNRHYLKLGYFDPPQSLEALAAFGNLPLFELPSPVSTFAPGLRSGIQYRGHTSEPGLIWAINLSSYGQKLQNQGEVSSSPARFTGRVVYLPNYQERTESQELLHLGLSTSFLVSGDGEIRYRSRPETFLAPFVVDTQDFSTDSAITSGVELLAVVSGYVHQIELFSSSVETDEYKKEAFSGGYYQISKFITGERRIYDPKRGILRGFIGSEEPERVSSKYGAFEVAARVSAVDLNSGAIRGGRMFSSSAALNWHYSNNIAWRFEYILANIRDTAETSETWSNILQTRLQLRY